MLQAAPLRVSSVLEGREAALGTLVPLFREHHRFLVTSHARPDGDAIGSALGTMHLLEAMGKEVTVAFADPVPLSFQQLPGAERIVAELPNQAADVVVVLECDSIARTGFSALPGSLVINIDHHRSGTNFATVNWIDAASPAVGAMIYELAVASGAELTPALASCLYAAVLTDTVSFTLPNVTADTFEIARHLLELGADAARISDAVYFSQRESKVRLLGLALQGLMVERPVAWSAVTRTDMRTAQAGAEDAEGIVQHLIAIEGVEAAVLLRELPDGLALRASLRSKGHVNVAEVAEGFGGGGHRNASGCTISGPLDFAAERMVEALRLACSRAGSAA